MRIVEIVSWFFVFLLSMSVRVAAQARTSAWFGDDTGQRSGRGTLNVVAHIDPIGSILLPLILLIAVGGPWVFGWVKPLQFNPLLWRDRFKATLAVNAVGPLSHLLLAGLALLTIKLMLTGGTVQPAPATGGSPFDLVVPASGDLLMMRMLIKQFNLLLLLNLAVGVWDLIPIPPLSGSFILESLLPDHLAMSYERLRPQGFLLILLLVWLGAFRMILSPILGLIRWLLFG